MKLNVFVSRPNHTTRSQLGFARRVEAILRSRDLTPITLGYNEFSNEAPLEGVREKMADCHGAVILGFKQLKIVDGVRYPGTREEDQFGGAYEPTPWNHIEAAMAYMIDLPLLVIREKGIEGGVFDHGVVSKYIHQVTPPGRDWLASKAFRQPFEDWVTEVRVHHTGKVRRSIGQSE